MPDSIAKLAIGAVIASLGYVAKLLVHEWRAWRSRREKRHARLLQLSSLLSATGYAFAIQVKHRDTLYRLLSHKYSAPTIHNSAGYEELFLTHFKTFTSEELDLHAIIRGLTVYGLGPSNRAMSKWLVDDMDFRTRRDATGYRGELAAKLNLLANHLLSWRAKYEVWIPNHPEHA